MFNLTIRAATALVLSSTAAVCFAGTGTSVSTGDSVDVTKTTGWEGSVGLGYSLAEGNTSTSLITAHARALRQWDNNELGLGLDYAYGEADDLETNNYLSGFAKYNRLISDRFYAGIIGSGLRDEISEIAYRATVFPYLGYYLINSPETKLAIEAGAGYLWEEQASIKDDYFALRFAQRFEHKISSRTKLTQSIEYLPRAEDFGDYLLTAELGLETQLTSRLSWKIAAQNRYDSTPAGGFDENDFGVVTGLSYSFTPVAIDDAGASKAAASAQGEWVTSAAFGLSATSGNTDTLFVAADLKAARKTEAGETLLGLGGLYGESDDVTTSQTAYGNAQYNMLINDRFYWGNRANALHDDIAETEYWVTAASVLGYYFVKNDVTTLSVEAGPGYTWQDIGNVKDEFAVGVVEEKFTYKLNDTVSFWQSAGYYVSLEDSDNWRLTAEAGADLQLGGGWSIRTSALNFYNNQPAAGLKKNDVKLISALAYTF